MLIVEEETRGGWLKEDGGMRGRDYVIPSAAEHDEEGHCIHQPKPWTLLVSSLAGGLVLRRQEGQQPTEHLYYNICHLLFARPFFHHDSFISQQQQFLHPRGRKGEGKMLNEYNCSNRIRVLHPLLHTLNVQQQQKMAKICPQNRKKFFHIPQNSCQNYLQAKPRVFSLLPPKMRGWELSFSSDFTISSKLCNISSISQTPILLLLYYTFFDNNISSSSIIFFIFFLLQAIPRAVKDSSFNQRNFINHFVSFVFCKRYVIEYFTFFTTKQTIFRAFPHQFFVLHFLCILLDVGSSFPISSIPHNPKINILTPNSRPNFIRQTSRPTTASQHQQRGQVHGQRSSRKYATSSQPCIGPPPPQKPVVCLFVCLPSFAFVPPPPSSRAHFNTVCQLSTAAAAARPAKEPPPQNSRSNFPPRPASPPSSSSPNPLHLLFSIGLPSKSLRKKVHPAFSSRPTLLQPSIFRANICKPAAGSRLTPFLSSSLYYPASNEKPLLLLQAVLEQNWEEKAGGANITRSPTNQVEEQSTEPTRGRGRNRR